MLKSKNLWNIYIVVLGLLAFTQEWIIINQELMVILAFFGIFFTLKHFLAPAITESLNEYSQNIKQNITDVLRKVWQWSSHDCETNSMQTHGLGEHLMYFVYVESLTGIKFYRVKTKLRKITAQKSKKRIFKLIFKILQDKLKSHRAAVRNI